MDDEEVCADRWRESGVVRTGEKQTVENGAKWRSSSRCVTNSNRNPTNDRSLLLSPGCNAHVQEQPGSPLCMRYPRQWETLRYIHNKQPIVSNERREKRFVYRNNLASDHISQPTGSHLQSHYAISHLTNKTICQK